MKYFDHDSGVEENLLSPKKKSTRTSLARAISLRRERFLESPIVKSINSKARSKACREYSKFVFARHLNARSTSLPMLAICSTKGIADHPPSERTLC